MKPTFRLLFVLSALSIALVGCATKSGPSAGAPQNESGETTGKAAEPTPPACKSIADVGNKTTPPDIYADMRQCAQDGNFENGVALFALAGSYSFYDALRVEDPSTFAVIKALPHDSFESLDAPNRASFKEAVKGALGNDEKRASICKEVMRAGPPAYYPAYMVLQGENGAAKVKTKSGLSVPFDGKAAWSEALSRFLHCS